MNNLQNHWSSQCSHFINRASEFVSFKVLETQFTIYGKSVFVLFFAGIFLPQIQSQVCNQTFDFSAAITVGPSQAPDTWYIDRYAPSSFSSPYNVPGEIVLKHSISTADGAINRPSGQQSSFYNTQGRKYGLSTNTKGVTIDLFIPATWATTDKREAGLWGTAVDISSNITAYPIIEFTSDIAGGGPRFQGWESGSGSFVDMGLPTGFIYDAWYTLEIELLPTGEFLFKVDDLEYTTTTSAPDGSVRIDNVILQGYNYDPTHAGSIETNPGVTYDIFWDNFIDIVPTVQNITTTDLYCSIQAAIDAASDDDVIEISDGAYLENIIIDLPITLQSTNGKLNSSINGDGSTPTILVTSDGVTIDGFTITNVGGANAVYSNNNSDITIQNCRIMDVGSASLSGTPVHALLIEASANTIDNIQILDNMIMALDGGQGGSVSAITIGFSTGNFDVTNTIIDGNMISDIDASNLPFASYPAGGRGAYGILINLGSGSGSGEVTSPQITNNTLSDLEGLWTHGIGLEGNTPGADVSGNDISDLTDHKSPSDAIAIFVEDNNGAATTRIKNNNFSSTSIGVANITGVEVDARLNWWSDASGPGLIAEGSGVSVSSDVLYCPWLTAPYVAGPPVTNNASVQNINTGEYFCSIQEAIDHASTSADDVLEILEADYTEPGQIVIDKALTLQGQGKLITTLRPGVNTGSIGNSKAFILVNPGIEFHLQDLTIDGSGVLVYQAIRHQGFGSVDQVAFTEIKYNESGPTYQGVAVAAFGNGDVDVTNSMFTEIGRVGVLYFGGGITNSLFKDNMYTGKGAGDWLDYALDISAGAGVLVEDNSISNNLGVASSDGSTSAGILVSTFFDPGTTADITGNDISGNSTGIFVGFNDSDGSTVTAHMNNITGNTIGVTTTNQPVDATGNWWGDASGPSGEGPGTGDAADPDVDFCGWLLQAYDGNPNPAVGGIPDPKQVTTTIEACSGSDYSFDLDTFFTNMAGDLGQVTYLYDVTVVPDVNVLSPDPRDMGVVSTDGAINNTIVNFGSQSLTVRYSITPTSQYGCVGPEFFVDVVINLDPQVDIIPNGSTSLCAGADRVISGTVVPPGTYTYLWEVIEDPANSGSSTILPANAQSPTLSVASDVTTGNLKIKFTATNNATGCMASDIFDFDVDAFCPVSPCTDLIDLNSAYLANDPHQSEFHAGTKVIADGTITSGNGENISFKAGNEVELRPIFEVEEGAVFTIDIEDCILEKDKPEEIETGEN